MVESRFLSRQLQICAEILPELVKLVLIDAKVLDVQLQVIMRANKQWGSKDRKFYGDTIFTFFRFFRVLTEKFGVWQNWEKETWLAAVTFCANISENTSMDWHLFIPENFALLYGHNLPIETFARLQLQRPPIWIRVCEDKNVKYVLAELEKKQISYFVHDVIKNAIAITSRVNLTELVSAKKYQFEVQDLASQCIGLVAAPKASESWLDCCCGSGGKTLQLYDLANGGIKITASDVRSKPLEELIRRAGERRRGKIKTLQLNFTNKSCSELGLFDGVLVDAPCSNTGTWRRNPALKWQLESSNIKEIAALQLAILEQASTHVKLDGRLVYSTCSVTEMENKALVKEFLVKHDNFELESFLHPATGALVGDGQLCIEPNLGDNDAMFVASFKRIF